MTQFPPVLTHETARALCEAGYMPLPEYIRLCAENGWVAEIEPPANPTPANGEA